MKPGRRSSVPIATAVVTGAVASGAAVGSPGFSPEAQGDVFCVPLGCPSLHAESAFLRLLLATAFHTSLILLCPSETRAQLYPNG